MVGSSNFVLRPVSLQTSFQPKGTVLDVGWCCDQTDQLLAFGGTADGSNGYYRVFRYDNTSQEMQEVFAMTGPTLGPVSQAVWCCVGNQKLVAFGDTSGNYAVFSYNSTLQQLVFVHSGASGLNLIRSICWLCDQNATLLSLGGDPIAFGPTLSVLRYPGFTSVPFASGTTNYLDGVVFKCSWCDNADAQLLAIGGSGSTQSVQVFQFNGTNLTNVPFSGQKPLTNTFFGCDWCCEQDTLLAVGGQTVAGQGKVFRYNLSTGQLDPVSFSSSISTINYGAWCCNGTQELLAIGGDGTQTGQIFQYQSASMVNIPFVSGQDPKFSFVTHTCWCCQPNNTVASFVGFPNSSAPSVQVYSYDVPNNNFQLVAYESQPPSQNTTYACDWCCVDNKKFLAIGGTDTQQPLQVYQLSATCNSFRTNVDQSTTPCNGKLTLTASGGTPPYFYSTDGGQTYEQFVSPYTVQVQPNHAYTIVIKDNNEPYPCESEPVTINVPGFFASSVDQSTTSCDGRVILTASGGTPPYFYSTDGGQTYEQFVSPYTVQLQPNHSYTIVIEDSTEPYPCESEPVTINVPDFVHITSIDYPHTVCVSGPVTVTCNVADGKTPYTYFINGAPQSEPTFIAQPGSTYTIQVEDSTEPYPCKTALQTITIPPFCQASRCFPQNKLLRIGKYTHGMPVQSVSWSAPTSDAPYALAAIGGYVSMARSCDSKSIRVYALDSITEKLVPIFADLPTDYIFSVDWCTINNTPYLAVAGCPNNGNNVWIYKYDPQYNTMEMILSSNAHDSIIYSVAWLENGCTRNPNIRNLAIGGEPAHGINLQVLQFDAATPSMSSLSSISFGATVFAVDWCAGTGDCNYLVAGGKTSTDCGITANIKVYTVTCDGDIQIATSAYYEGGTVRAAKWCCTTSLKLPVLAVGGDPMSAAHDKNIQLYAYYTHVNKLKTCAVLSQPSKVFALDWLNGCNCTELVAGSGCNVGTCPQNMAVYSIEKCQAAPVSIVTSTHCEDNITSISSVKIDDVTFILVGSESNNWHLPIVDPLCPILVGGNELALYKGLFCSASSTKPFKPVSICDRTRMLS